VKIRGNEELEGERRAIAARWRSIERLRAWANLPRSRREAMYAELEETARAVVGDDERRDWLAAADALESVVQVLEMFGAHFAAKDVEALLALTEARDD